MTGFEFKKEGNYIIPNQRTGVIWNGLNGLKVGWKL
ncbi:hypothetical protein LCGC14_1642270 [marine sediment metagenome]|uniref:Uncharacterized protein n=1 Tax=marine sediment metagenome TaxID=412755 RepID=A0A0F9ILR9_9ZZZZ